MSKIWLVSRGEYSDYHVICAFSTPQKAVSYSRAAKDSFIETLSLDEDMPETAECIHVLVTTLPVKTGSFSDNAQSRDSRWRQKAPSGPGLIY